MHNLLCPSMMCADFKKLDQEVSSLDRAGTDIFHCDVMDGSFVPNFALGLHDIRSIRQLTDKPVDVHLMIEKPSCKVDWFIEAGADIIYIHPESERYVSKTLSHIKESGKMAGLAINPDTSLETVKEMLVFCDYILMMTVDPGFAGQKFQEYTVNKIKQMVNLKKLYTYKVIIDGACSPKVIKDLSSIGVDGFVLGTSALFEKNKNYRECFKDLRQLEI